MTLLLGIDLGTSFFKVALFDQGGALQGLGRVPVATESSGPGRCELPVATFWTLLRRGLAEALQQAGAEAGQIAGLAYSSQANTFLLLDDHDAPLTPLVLWTDLRAAELGGQWRGFGLSEDFGRRIGFTGCSPHSAAVKCLWFQQQQPELWTRALSVMTISDYLTFALTGERVGDAGTAALLGIYDLGAEDWWSAARLHFGVAEKELSRPLRPGRPGGRTTALAGKLLGLPAGIPLAVGGLDHHVAALGAGLGSVADASISTGTVLAAVALTERVVPQAGCYHGPDFAAAGFYRLCFNPDGAGQLEEYRRAFAPNLSIEQLLALAGKAPAGLNPAPTTSRPARPAEHGAAFRRLLEKIAFGHRTLLDQVRGETTLRRIVATGGGARSEVWLQIKADMLGLPILAQSSAECACLGAAMLASVAAGWHQTVSDAAVALAQSGKEFRPDPANATLYRNWLPGDTAANA